ncbi:MAG TPA: MerR family DNA-binding transcriptional regulator [Alphaproteobacteria bacterium]|nr:MerR family DNA-binding transcriptional regulator [Alphaproteobacteria bacterium]
MAERLGITELSREFDVTTRTIRFYEDEGLLAPERRGQTRIYSARDRVRLRLILRGKRLGFSLLEIKEIIDLYDRAPGELGQLRHFLAKIEERRRQLRQQREDIEITLRELSTVEARCHERLAELEKGGRAGKRAGRAKG